MSLPPWKRDLRGQTCTISMMDLRKQPGEVLDAVFDGMVINIERNGRHVGTLVPPGYDPATTVVLSDGSIKGPPLLTQGRRDLLRN